MRTPKPHPLLVLPLLAALTAAAALAQPPINGLQRTGKFVLEIEGDEAAGARIYQSNQPPAVLVVSNSSKMPDPVLIDVATGSVQTVNLMQMAEQPGDRINLLPGAGLAPQPPFRVDGVDAGLTVRFSVEGVDALLRPKPPLLGQRSAEELGEHSPEYVAKAEAYQPSGPVIARLRREERPVTVRVFFGTWCSACSQLVPLIMRVDRELEGSSVDFQYYGLPQGKAFEEDPEATRYGVTAVPTGLVFVGGKEVGRLQGNSWRVPEMTLNRLLSGS